MLCIFCLKMKRLLTIASLLLIFIAYAESLENSMEYEELHRCYAKLICEKDKLEEFFNVSRLAGPENSQRHANLTSQIIHLEDPKDTLEFWILFKDPYCEWTEERKEKAFNDWMALVGEHMLEVCIDPTSEICFKAEYAANEFGGLLSKYKAMGVCDDMAGVPEAMMPGGMGPMASPFG